MEYYSALKKKEILTPAPTWMNLQDTVLSEIARHRRTQTVWVHLRELPGAAKFIEIENRMVVSTGWRRMGRGAEWGVIV